jgi:hypothetical protein
MKLLYSSQEESQKLVSAAAKELESYVIKDEENGLLRPVICSVCDGIPDDPYWHEMVNVAEFAKLCNTGQLHKSLVLECYPPALVSQYTVPHELLQNYVLSPDTIIDNNGGVCVCKKCLADLENNTTLARTVRCKPPKQSIANGYLILNACQQKDHNIHSLHAFVMAC